MTCCRETGLPKLSKTVVLLGRIREHASSIGNYVFPESLRRSWKIGNCLSAINAAGHSDTHRQREQALKNAVPKSEVGSLITRYIRRGPRFRNIVLVKFRECSSKIFSPPLFCSFSFFFMGGALGSPWSLFHIQWLYPHSPSIATWVSYQHRGRN